MKAAPHHYLVAYTLPFTMTLGAIAGIATLTRKLHEEGVFVSDFGVWIWIVLAAIPAGLLGLILGVLFIWPFLGRIAMRIQGWPFQVGDEVVILTGKHKNTVTRIYAIWEDRGEVRVDLGEELRESVKDVFCALKVCRHKKGTPNQAVEATS